MKKELIEANKKLSRFLNEENLIKDTKKKKKVLKEAKDDYEIYHKLYSSAVAEAKRYCEEQGFYWNDNEVWHKVSVGPKRPSEGKTNRFSLQLYTKDKAPAGKAVHVQIYGMKDKYELNTYLSPLRKDKYEVYESIAHEKTMFNLLESMKEYAGVLSESSKLADKKAEIRSAVLRAVTAGSSMKSTLSKLSSKFGVPVVTEDPDDDDLSGFFLVDLDKMKDDKESFVSYINNELK